MKQGVGPIWFGFKRFLGVTIGIVAVIIFGTFCNILSEDAPEIEGTAGMTESAGWFETKIRGNVKYRILRHPREDANPKTELLLKQAISATERFMGTAFPAKTVVLIFDDATIPTDTIGQVRALPGANFLAPISHNLSARWVRIEVRPEQESNSDSLNSVLAHEVAHYYWNHHTFDGDTTDFYLDEGAAHFLEYKLSENSNVWESAQFVKLCIEADSKNGPSESQIIEVLTTLELDYSAAQIRRVLSSDEFTNFFLLLCSEQSQISRYTAAGVLIRAEEIMGRSRFRRAFHEIWKLSKSNSRTAVDVFDIHDVLCSHSGTRRCAQITDAFEEFGFNP